MKILFVVPSLRYFPSWVVRVKQYFPYLDDLGIAYDWIDYLNANLQHQFIQLDHPDHQLPVGIKQITRVFLKALRITHTFLMQWKIILVARRYDAVFLQAILPPLWFSRLLTLLHSRVVYDFDDALFIKNPTYASAIISRSWKVIAGSHFNYEYAHPLNRNTILIPSSVSVENYHPSFRDGAGTLRIGWIGSSSTLHQLKILEEAMRILEEQGYCFEWIIAGTHNRSDLIPDLSATSVVEIAGYQNEDIPDIVASFDIGVMPLYDGAWERGKCAMKALVYMSGGKPVICSRVGENNHLIKDGENGFLAGTSDEWVSAIKKLSTDPELRQRIGLQGRKTVEREYSTQVCFDELNRQVLDELRLEKQG